MSIFKTEGKFKTISLWFISSCFKVVSPAPYHDLCLKFAYKAKNSESAFQSQLESLVAGYRATCRRWEISRKFKQY